MRELTAEEKEIIRKNGLWRRGEPGGVRADLRGVNLSCADLSEADLSRAILSGADLCGAGLYGADLYGADLSRADLSEADLSHANLSYANLSRADLSGADLSRADLSCANLSGARGLLDASEYLKANLERNEAGYIVYKTFGETYAAPDQWRLEPGAVLEEVCNPNRTDDCGCGINVGTAEWVGNNYSGTVYRLLIRWEWLAGVVVPYNTDGKIRCSRAEIIGLASE